MNLKKIYIMRFNQCSLDITVAQGPWDSFLWVLEKYILLFFEKVEQFLKKFQNDTNVKIFNNVPEL